VDGEGPVRQCVACRERAPADALLRLVAAPDGRAVVDLRARLPGRGAWAHPRCLQRLTDKPAPLSRALRSSVHVEDLYGEARAGVLHALRDGLSLAAAGGGLVGGHDALVDALRNERVRVVMTASDAAERTLRSIAGAIPTGVESVALPMTRDALGTQVGQGARAALGVLPVPASAHLLRQLRRLRALG